MYKCKKCGIDFEVDWRKDRRTRRDTPIPPFCSRVCANSRTQTEESNAKRREKMINKKIKFVARHSWNHMDRARSTAIRIKNIENYIRTASWEELSKRHRKIRLMFEQNNRCDICKLEPMWNGKKLVFRYDHIDGKNKTEYDNRRDNLHMICPNCDSQLDTYCSKNATVDGRRRMAEAARKNYANLRNRSK